MPGSRQPGDTQLVEFEGPFDPLDMHNMSLARKWTSTIFLASGGCCVACASSIYASTDTATRELLGVSHEVNVLPVTLFLLGLGIGPMILAPLSEFYGRVPIYLPSLLFFCIFQLPTALGQNLPLILISRFLAGLAGSSFLSVAGGTLNDVFRVHELAAPMQIFTAAPFVGTIIGPLTGGFLLQYSGSWRNSFWMILGWGTATLLGIVLFIPETYPPALLRRKAKKIRKETGDTSIKAPVEIMDKSVARTVALSCLRPLQFLTHEPICFLLNLWTGLLLAILYLFFISFPNIFMELYGFTISQVGLAFLGIGLGQVLALCSQPLWRRHYAKKVAANGDVPTPEMRLTQSKLGGLLVPGGLFWFAFVLSADVHFLVPIAAGVPFGFGFILIFTSVLTYLSDAYGLYSASAIACHSLLRTTLAAIFPLFTNQVYSRLGFRWASALVGFLTLALSPLPFLFSLYGQSLRAKSPWASGSRGPESTGFLAGTNSNSGDSAEPEVKQYQK